MKAQTRHELSARIAAMTAAERAADSAAVCERLRRLPELAGTLTVLGYAATTAECDVDPLLEELLAAGHTVCLPWVNGDHLGVTAVDGLDGLAPGWRGLREPPPDRRQPLRPQALDVVVAPGLGFDPAGRRLGRGGGHYDRLLARLRRGAVVVGVAFDVQIHDPIPVEPHDRAVDVVVTPARVWRVA